MTLYSDTVELIKLSNKIRSKGNGGLFDEFFIEKFKLQKIRKCGPFAKFMRFTYYHSFGRKRIVRDLRFDFFEVKEALFNLHVRVDTNEDCKKALELAENYYNSLPKPKENKWDRKTYLYFVLIPSFLGLVQLIHGFQADWILLLMGIFSIGLFLPLLSGFGASSLFSIFLESWWNKHWRKEFGIDVLKNKIIDQTMENPLAQ